MLKCAAPVYKCCNGTKTTADDVASKGIVKSCHDCLRQKGGHVVFNIGFSELILVLLVAFLIVGPKDLPKVARWLGRTVRRARQLIQELKKETGWDELEKEAASVKQEIDQTVKENDVTADIRSAANDLRRNVQEAQTMSKQEP